MAKDPKNLPGPGGWDWLWRGLFVHEDGGTTWTVDTDYFDLGERIRLYRDGELVAAKASPATFDLDDGRRVEAAMSTYGMRHVRMRGPDGASVPFAPGPGTGEEWRADLEVRHPKASRAVAAVSWTVIVVAAVTQLPNLLHTLGNFLGFDFPTFELPAPADVTLTVLGVLAGIDRALRHKFVRFLDD